MRLRATQVRETIVSVPGYEVVVESEDGDTLYEDLEIVVDQQYHLVRVKIRGEKVHD